MIYRITPIKPPITSYSVPIIMLEILNISPTILNTFHYNHYIPHGIPTMLKSPGISRWVNHLRRGPASVLVDGEGTGPTGG